MHIPYQQTLARQMPPNPFADRPHRHQKHWLFLPYDRWLAYALQKRLWPLFWSTT